jgi:hypothetical protein
MGRVLARSVEIHVRGTLPPDLLSDFEYLEAEVVPAATILRGVVPDQAALYGVLLRLQALGLELLEVRQLGSEVTD